MESGTKRGVPFERQSLLEKKGGHEMEAGVIGMIGCELWHAGVEFSFSGCEPNRGPLDRPSDHVGTGFIRAHRDTCSGS